MFKASSPLTHLITVQTTHQSRIRAPTCRVAKQPQKARVRLALHSSKFAVGKSGPAGSESLSESLSVPGPVLRNADVTLTRSGETGLFIFEHDHNFHQHFGKLAGQ